MTFDESKVYTALNAEDIEIGSEVIAASNLADLKNSVEKLGEFTYTLQAVRSPDHKDRFTIGKNAKEQDIAFNLVYLISEPTKLKWTDLKVGDILRKGSKALMVTGIDTDSNYVPNKHVCLNGYYVCDEEINEWELVRQ